MSLRVEDVSDVPSARRLVFFLFPFCFVFKTDSSVANEWSLVNAISRRSISSISDKFAMRSAGMPHD